LHWNARRSKSHYLHCKGMHWCKDNVLVQHLCYAMHMCL
jgi:hypothetical protein